MARKSRSFKEQNYVTIGQLAKLSEVNLTTVYRHVESKGIKAEYKDDKYFGKKIYQIPFEDAFLYLVEHVGGLRKTVSDLREENEKLKKENNNLKGKVEYLEHRLALYPGPPPRRRSIY